jgi:hypothetical protein
MMEDEENKSQDNMRSRNGLSLYSKVYHISDSKQGFAEFVTVEAFLNDFDHNPWLRSGELKPFRSLNAHHHHVSIIV